MNESATPQQRRVTIAVGVLGLLAVTVIVLLLWRVNREQANPREPPKTPEPPAHVDTNIPATP